MNRGTYDGGPSKELVAIIHAHTYVDHGSGKRFYSRNGYDKWLTLRSRESFEDLNRIIDTYRSKGPSAEVIS